MDEVTTYSVIGRVEIGTDEYRDLISQNCQLKAERDRFYSERWTEARRADAAESKLKDLSIKFEELAAFVKSDEAITTRYKLFRLEKVTKEEE